MGRHVLACLLDAPSGLVPVLPRVDSYQRLVDNCWVPSDDGWAFEHRLSNIRFIAPLQWPSRRPHGSNSALRSILSVSSETESEPSRRQDQQPQNMPVWALGGLEIGLTAAVRILFSLSAHAASDVRHLSRRTRRRFRQGLSPWMLHRATASTMPSIRSGSRMPLH
ncbi:hypothetical protein HMPREF1624_03725 [Sporothrix schenckii ATCC 58251]|uniref:Uncharacterized protein n=1 Tax=Sporothrix schenckii (strain ATCC 58251 / de Perez 2211183) TaxID=1391915 RepID=U7PXG6_SPOS1|nr:hypothetical protein HMPREF1624_03725 [Sporothrix schenckii ATCC 58251]